MKKLTGKSIVKGTAIGKIKVIVKAEAHFAEKSELTPEEEKLRFEAASEKAKEQLDALYEKALREVGEEEAGIFEVHKMMLEDEDYLDSVNASISAGSTAENAVTETGAEFSEMFAGMDDEYMRARASDVRDVSQRVVNVLTGCEAAVLEEPSIIAAEELTPSETVGLDKTKILGFVTHTGSTTSHTAILARTMNIPTIFGIEVDKEWDGKTAILDGTADVFIVEPDAEALKEAEKRAKSDREHRAALQALIGLPNVTKDGRSIDIYANIGSVEDAVLANNNDAGGVGLFRTEFLYLAANDFPHEDTLFEAYKKAAEILGSKKLVIRTLDIGADKQTDYLKLDKEDNPALGLRAIRVCLTRPEIFKTQLRAMLRAAAFGNVAIMLPMIISLWEFEESKALLEECRRELADEGKEFGEVELGIEIETPAAALIADDLAVGADFFSVGTNDMTQYALAVDRQNLKLDKFADTHHPAVLKLIKMTVDAGHRHGTRVGICGELAADMDLTETFIRMGVDELSVNPSAILPLREKVRELDLS